MLPGLRRGAFLPLLIGISIVLSKNDYTFASVPEGLGASQVISNQIE